MRILLADDNEPFRRRLRHTLGRGSGFELVGEATDGEEAIRLARQLIPDIVIMDILMPRMNGIDATRQITTAFPLIKVIGLSLQGDAGLLRAMIDAGASVCFLKEDVLHELPAPSVRSPGARPLNPEIRQDAGMFPAF